MPPVIAILANQQQTSAGEFTLLDITQRAYTEAILAAGGAPLVLPAIEDEAAVRAVLQRTDGLLVTGGADLSPDLYGQQPLPKLGGVSPLRDALDRTTLQYAAEADLPVLGICRGIQAMAVFAGGALIQDIPSQVPDCLQHNQQAPGWHGLHEIDIAPDSRLARLTGRTQAMVNTFHHQALRDVPPGYVASAYTADGMIEAIEKPEAKFHLGLQFHPELMAPRHDFIAAVFRGFVQACGG